jgi:hypothetical protein
MRQVTIQINPLGISIELNKALEKALNLARIGLNVPEMSPSGLEFPDTAFQFAIESHKPWDEERASVEFRTWVLSNAFRDVSEATGAMLDGMHQLAFAAKFSEQMSTGSALTEADWDEQLATEMKRFHRLGIPDKLDQLKEQYGLSFGSDMEQQVLSINAARNCLVHRNGIVGERDVNSGDELIVHWRELYFVLTNEDGEHEVTLPVTAIKDSSLGLKERLGSKSFKKGERVNFDVIEFSNICWTLHRLGANTADTMIKYCQSHGIGSPPPAT